MTTAGNNAKGFTLLELIITILISAIVSVYIYNFVHSNTINASKNVLMFKDRLSIENDVESITAEYKRLIARDGSNFSLTDLNTYITANYDSSEVSVSYVAFNNNTGASQVTASGSAGAVMVVTLSRGYYNVKAYFAQ